ncbi:hypothetical protein H8959_016982 [Pygathrix nigripes]
MGGAREEEDRDQAWDPGLRNPNTSKVGSAPEPAVGLETPLPRRRRDGVPSAQQLEGNSPTAPREQSPAIPALPAAGCFGSGRAAHQDDGSGSLPGARDPGRSPSTHDPPSRRASRPAPHSAQPR